MAIQQINDVTAAPLTGLQPWRGVNWEVCQSSDVTNLETEWPLFSLIYEVAYSFPFRATEKF
jgi:hypothetical protein